MQYYTMVPLLTHSFLHPGNSRLSLLATTKRKCIRHWRSRSAERKFLMDELLCALKSIQIVQEYLGKDES